ncbi:MAG: DUF6702 family protein [Pirellulales bacterium]
MIRLGFLSICVLLFHSAILPSLTAHPFHTSTAEMEWNSQSRRLEVAVRVYAVDVERVLKLRESRISQADKLEFVGRSEQLGPQERSDVKNLEHPANDSERVPNDLKLNEKLLCGYIRENIFVDVIESDAEQEGKGAGLESVLKAGGNSSFRIKDGEKPGFHWLGWEAEENWIWCYFELEYPSQALKASAERKPIRLHNTLLFDLNATQINTCTLRDGRSKTALKFDLNNSQQRIPELSVSQ